MAALRRHISPQQTCDGIKSNESDRHWGWEGQIKNKELGNMESSRQILLTF